MYQLVRYFPGRWAFVGTVIVPLAVCCLLLSVPMIDRGTKRSARAASFLFFAVSTAIFILTMVPVLWP